MSIKLFTFLTLKRAVIVMSEVDIKKEQVQRKLL